MSMRSLVSDTSVWPNRIPFSWRRCNVTDCGSLAMLFLSDRTGLRLHPVLIVVRNQLASCIHRQFQGELSSTVPTINEVINAL